MAVLICATAAQAAPPNKTTGGTLYNANPDCSGCHGATPNAANNTGIGLAANNPTLIGTAANCPNGTGTPGGVTYTGGGPNNGVNSCSQMYDGPAGAIQTSIGPGAAAGAANRADVAYYIADYVAPVLITGTVATPFNTPIVIDLTPYISGYNSAGNFTFAGGNAASVAIVGTAPTHGAVSAPAGLSVTYTPSATASNVSDTFSFTATSPQGNVSAATTITVNIGAAPVPNAANVTIGPIPYQSVGYSIDLTATVNAVNPGPPAGIATGLASPAPPPAVATANGGSVTALTPPYTLTYTAPTDRLTDSFTYTVRGPGGTSTAKTVTVNIATPAPPGANTGFSVNAAFNAGAPTVTSSVLNIAGAFNTTGANGPVNSYGTPVEVVGANNGTVTSGPGVGQVTYTPKALYIGTDQFTISATNPGGTTTSTVTVNIQAPTAPTRLTTPVNTNATYNNGPPAAQTTIDLSTGVFGGYVQGLQVGGAALPTTTPHGTIAQGANPEVLLYTPALGFHGVDTFTVTAYNQTGSSPPVTVNATTNLPATPVAHNLTVPVSIAYNTATPIDLSASITGVLSTTNPVAITQPAHGTATVSGEVVTYTPAANYYGGPDAFTYTATGPGGTSGSATVSLTVAIPAAPSSGSKAVAVIYDTPAPINVQPLITGLSTTVAIGSPPSHGTAVVSGYTITYTPANGYLGPDQFTYSATGPGGTSLPGTLSITVSALPTVAPTVTLHVPLNSPTSANLANYITGSGITGVQILVSPGHGSVTVNGTTITYSPVFDFFGTDSFTYRAFGAGGTSSGTVTIQIDGRPNPAQNADVSGLIDAQIAQARTFTRTQIGNFQQRMENLHRGATPNDQEGTTPGAPQAAANAPGSAARLGGPAGALASAAAQNALGSAAQTGASSDDGPNPSAQPPAARGASALIAAAVAPGRAPLPPASDPFADGPAAAPIAPIAPIAPALDTSNGQFRMTRVALAGAPLVPSAADPIDGSGRALAAPLPVNLASLNLASLEGSLASGGDPLTGVGAWVTGAVNFGNREQQNGLPQGLKFHTDGISLGADRRLADNLVAGLGVGYAYDSSEVGTDGTQSKASGTVVAAYASYQPTPNTFVDGVIGVGTLTFDTVRPVPAFDQVAHGNRGGEQVFASVTAGYDFHPNDMHLAPYGRLDVSSDRLHQYAETGAGVADLSYAAQTVTTTDLAVGLRFDALHATSFGSVSPHARLEYQHDFEGNPQASVAYADLFGGQNYAVPTNTVDHNALVGGIGVDFNLQHGLMFGVDYQALRASGSESSQLVRFHLSQQLDGGLLPSGTLLPLGTLSMPVGLRADASYTFDDNVTRNDGVNKLSDQSYALNLTRPILVPIIDNVRLLVTPFVGGEKFVEYGGLNHLVYGANAQLQYRPDGDFGTPIYALFLRANGDDFNSYERTGYRYSGGLSVNKPLTDRIALFGALSYEDRRANTEVFDDQTGSARLNLDYALSAHATPYLSLEYRRGDVVSTGAPNLSDLNIASVAVRDDVFSDSIARVAYRFRANTYLLGIGYNYALGETDSLDLSWRFAQSTPLRQPNYLNAEFVRYFDNQITVVYLVRF